MKIAGQAKDASLHGGNKLAQTGKYPTLKAAVLDRMRDDILSRTLEPGAIIKDNDLAKHYGVSSSPIREALAQMVMERLVDVLPNKAKRVSPIDKKTVADFLEFHSFVVKAGFCQGVSRLNSTQLRAVEDAYNDVLLYHDKKDISAYLEALKSFLDPILSAGGNRELRRQIYLASTWLTRIVFMMGDQFYDDALRSATAILESIKHGDVGKAIIAHFEMTESFSRKALALDLPD